MATTTATRLGPADHGRRLTLAEFVDAEAEEGYLYELARGVVVVTQVPAPEHGMVIDRLAEMFIVYRREHPGLITYRAGGGECRLRLPGMQSDRHPDQAVYLTPPPSGPSPWDHWTPAIVVEVVSVGGEGRDYVEKREEYLRAGVAEYWVLDPSRRLLTVLRRAGDVWEETLVADGGEYRTPLLPGLVVRPGELLGPAAGAE